MDIKQKPRIKSGLNVIPKRNWEQIGKANIKIILKQ